jgi:hypothetical protein
MNLLVRNALKMGLISHAQKVAHYDQSARLKKNVGGLEVICGHGYVAIKSAGSFLR